MATEIKEGVYWVGVVDWALKKFHGHELSTHRGSTYNSYLVMDEKIVLVDTVWAPFQDQLVENISQIIDPSKIDMVVANHAEVDHSGSLPAIMRHTPNATVIVSPRGRESIEGHYHQAWNFKAVKTGQLTSVRLMIAVNESNIEYIEGTIGVYLKSRLSGDEGDRESRGTVNLEWRPWRTH